MDAKQSRKDAAAKLSAFVEQYTSRHPGCSKDDVAKAVARQFGLRVERSVYVGSDFAVRFSSAAGSSFSNTVLSLSALSKYDHLPVIVCVIRPTGAQLVLANSTLIDKISHSSHRLTHDQIRGSFNGTNILRDFDGLSNEPNNFDALFEKHLAIGFAENYARIVDNTLAIGGRGTKFTPSAQEIAAILASPDLAAKLLADKDYRELTARLADTVASRRDAILRAATSGNVNLRGNSIEQIVTSAGNLHRAEDIVETLPSGVSVYLNIKTKLIGHSSNPVAYNIDKLLQLLSRGDAAFAFLFVGINLADNTVTTRMASFLDTTIMGTTRIQPHWAGRNSRGGAQLSDLPSIFSPSFHESIEVGNGRQFLQMLISL